MVAYEYLFTLKDEHTVVLRKKWTATTWIFLINRYVMVFGAITELLPSTPTVSAGFCGNTYDDLTIELPGVGSKAI